MQRVLPALCLGLSVLLPSIVSAADRPLSEAGETPAEKLRKALDRVRELEIAEQTLDRAVNQLREQTGINFLIDQAAVPATPQSGGTLSPVWGYPQIRLSGQFHGLPVRTAVARMLQPHNLVHVVVGDTVLITTAEKASDRQLRQTVSVKAEATPLGGVLKQLARETGANLVLDSRASKEAQTTLTLRLDEVPLETAVEVLADEAGLRALRLSNVLYVTSEARAEKLRKTQRASLPASGGWQVWPDGKGGFQLTPPAGVLGGMLGVAGGAGLGGGGGIAGLGGGGFNQLGGAVKPVPLTPPVPRAKTPEPAKPRKEAPPAKPAVKPPAGDKPAPKDNPAAEAPLAQVPSRRSRRNRAIHSTPG